MKTGLTLQEAIACESPEMKEKIRQETDRLRVEYAIIQIRNDLEISQAKLAGLLGVSQTAVYKVEHAGKDLTSILHTVFGLSFLRVSIL